MILVSISLILTVNKSYVSAISIPVAWEGWEIFATLLSMVGVTVSASTLVEYSEDINDLANQFSGYIVDGYNASASVIAKTAEEFNNFMMGSQVTGRIENMSNDLYKALKGFASNIFKTKTVAPSLPDGVIISNNSILGSSLCSMFGIPQSNADWLDKYVTNRKNIAISKFYHRDWHDFDFDYGISIGNLDYNMQVYVGSKFIIYDSRDGKYIPRDSLSMGVNVLDAYFKDGVNIKNKPMMNTAFASIDIIGFFNIGDNVYSSLDNLVSKTPGLDLPNDSDTYPDVTTVAGVNKLWEKYGNLDNLGVGTTTGIISTDVIGRGTWEQVIGGSIPLDNVIPFPLVDTKEKVIVDDDYADEDAESKPWETVDYGPIGDYTMGNIVTTVFPFCIPFDMIRLFKVLTATAVAPRWEIPLNIPKIGFSYKFVIDFAMFESLASIFRIIETIFFILALILATRKLIGD